MELLTIVLNGSTQNVNIFRENNGCKCVLQLITESALHRSQALSKISLKLYCNEQSIKSFMFCDRFSSTIANEPWRRRRNGLDSCSASLC